jgi:methyl-accepting chemotaxis protein
MRIIYKINLAVVVLLAVSALLVGSLLFSAYRDLRAETYRWFDANAKNLTLTVGNQAKESLAYFDFKAIESALQQRVAEDPNLLYVSVGFGDGLKERREAGSSAAGPFRAFDGEVKDDVKTVATVTIHYGTAGLESKLAALATRLLAGAVATLTLLLALLSFFVMRFVSRPLRQLVRHVEVVAAGDLTAAIAIASKDEFGDLAAALTRMTANLRAMFEKVRSAFGDLEVVSRDIAEVSHRIAEGGSGQTEAVTTVSSSIDQMNASIKSVVQSVENLFSLAGESSSSMLEMSASVEQVAGNAEGLSAAVESTTASITEMTLSIRTVAENVERLADLVTNTSSSITEIDSIVREIERNAGQGHELTREVARTMGEEGLAVLRRTGDGMVAIRSSVSQAAAVVRGLEARSHEIGGILAVINEVNDQTNLLALNAAILAAQAGEHGRGFAVVAEEIRELSGRTAASTKEITKLIVSVKKEATNAVEAMDNGTQRVEEGVRTVEELSETIRRAAENSEKASAASRGIAQATTEQYKGIRQIATASQNINEMCQEIARATREQSAGGTQILKASESVRELAHQVKKAMSEQSKGVRLTSRASEESARLAQQVLDASREEARGSDLVVKSIGSIQEISNTNAAGVKRLDAMVSILAAQADQLKTELGRFKIG